MPDIDLIPADYRRELVHRRLLAGHAVAAAALIAGVAAASGATAHFAGKLKAEVSTLQQRQNISAAQQADLAQLRERETRLKAQNALLEGLRGGAAAERMFAVVDRALEGDEVWFLRWEFQRARARVEPQPEAVHTGYILVVPQEAGKTETWQLQTHMKITGQARDHAALSRFVGRLLAQPEVEQARLLNTALRKQPAGELVEFDLAVTVNAQGGQG